MTGPEDDGTNSAPSAAEFDFQEHPQPNSRGSHLDLFDNQIGGSGSDWISRSGDERNEEPLFLWVEVNFPHLIVLDHFTMTSGNGDAEDDPKGWEIQGSNDGTHFDTIFHRTNPDESVWTERAQVVRFDAGVHYARPAAYKTIRFSTNFHRAWRLNEKFQLGELEFFGTQFESEITEIQRLDQDLVRIEWTSLLGSSTYAIDASNDLELWIELDDGVSSQGNLTQFTADVSVLSTSDTVYLRVREE